MILLPSGVAGQVTPADTSRVRSGDTIRVAIPSDGVESDTLPADSTLRTPQDTTAAPVFPRYVQPLPTGWGSARWEWGQEALSRYHGLTILEFLERAPGLSVIRSGDHGYAAGLSAYGLGGGRTRLFLDGFELDPLGFTTPELQHLGTIDLESVRVERQLTGVRIELQTLRLPGRRPHSAVEAATGTYDSKLLRGMLIRSASRRSILAGAYDAVSTKGFRFAEPFNLTSARASWSYALSQRTGLQLEFRNTAAQVSSAVPPENSDRKLVLLRGRSEVRPGLMVDAALGRSWRSPGGDDDLLTSDLTSTQGYLRGAFSVASGWMEATARLRTGSLESVAAPGIELGTRAVYRPARAISAEGEIRTASLGGQGSVIWTSTVRVGEPGGLGAFASVAGGEQGVGVVRDSITQATGTGSGAAAAIREPRYSAISSGVGAARVGSDWARGDFTAGLAAIALASARIAPFGLAFDRGAAPIEADAARGIEMRLASRVPFTGELARVDASFVAWQERGERPFLPAQEGRAALLLHGRFFDAQLEPTARVELLHRGAMLVPALARDAAPGVTAPYTLLNLFLQIRILELQAFGRWENLLNYQLAEDVPSARLPGQRLIYGIRWAFRD